MEIVKYKIQKFSKNDEIPADAIFMLREAGSKYVCGSYYPYEYYVFQVPIYKTTKAKK